MEFEPQLEEILVASGWSRSRNVDVTNWVQVLELAGYTVNPNAVQLLRSVGGLTVRPLECNSQIYHPSEVRFDPLLFQRGGPLREYETKLGVTLTPLGECFGQAELFLAADGRMYSSFDWFFHLVGESVAMGLRTLLIADVGPTRLKL